jgi:hypothetical protein
VVTGRLENWEVPKLRMDIDMLLLLSSYLVEVMLRYRKLDGLS